MFYNNWFWGVDSIGGFFKRLGLIIITIILMISYLVGIGYINEKIINEKVRDSIVVLTSILNMIVIMALPILIILLLFIYFKFKKDVHES